MEDTGINDTSGQAHPYWYEWFVGLIEVVKLLNPDEKVSSVAFQVASIKVWDDVVVTLDSGRRYYQIKHTRQGKNLTFGSLVQADERGKTLLGELFKGWSKSRLDDPKSKLIIYTNRNDGIKWTTLESGRRRPPLLEFWNWLKKQVATAASLSDVVVPDNYKEGWEEWRRCLRSKDKARPIRFLRQLELRLREADLDGLEDKIRAALARSFGISTERAAPLFDALCRALRDWTTGHPGVTIEGLCTALTVPPEAKELAQAPPPPTPFFPTRLPVASRLESILQAPGEAPVVFLFGEPGSGKTSVVSWLANRRTKEAFEGIVGIRFFCFEPIRPERPFIDPDSARVKPEDLWFSLLSQLRRGLEGRLYELTVPLHNSLLEWAEARKHVLRLASVLGKELGRPFVISIDGIDHAARASQVLPEQVASFFASLPTPEELGDANTRLFIAGQPPEYYVSQYPSWLQGAHPKVRRIDLPTLDQSDIRTLLSASRTLIPASQFDEAVRLIAELSKGNTLAIVFAVAESESKKSLLELEATLRDRSLASGITDYYQSIWQHAIRTTPELDCSLAGAISLARRPLTPSQLHSVFVDWNKPVAWWHEVLLELGPLLVARNDGFQIRHNDVRVFLAARFNGHSEAKRQVVASNLASHFRDATSDRLSAHLQLFDLLKLANRQNETSDVFNTDWVLEGSVLEIPISQLRDEGETAAFALSESANWSNVVSVACGLHTLTRLDAEADTYPTASASSKTLPPFLPSEASVRPLQQWTKEDFHQLVWDAYELAEGGEEDRAKGLLDRWLGGVPFRGIVKSLPGIEDELRVRKRNHRPDLAHMVASDFELLGSLCVRLAWPLKVDSLRGLSSLANHALFAFDKGAANQMTKDTAAVSLEELFRIHRPRYVLNLELAVRNLAQGNKWQLVAEILPKLDRTRFSLAFLAECTWYALQSGVSEVCAQWLQPLSEPGLGLPEVERHVAHDGIALAPYINVARALGWTRLGLDVGDISDRVFKAFDPPETFDAADAMKLVFRTAAILGRLDCRFHAGDKGAEAQLVTPKQVLQVLSALWGDVVANAPFRFEGRTEAAEVAAQLSEYCSMLGGEFEAAALEAALPLAEQFVLGPRRVAIWNVVMRAGRLDVLRKWTSHYLASDGAVWNWANHEVRETVSEFAPLARSIGQGELADCASTRARSLRISYQDRKEYSFEEVSEWLASALTVCPQAWSTYGWKLWQICVACDDRHADNAFGLRILDAISAAAIRCGASAWHQLMATTLSRASHDSWHNSTRERIVDGARLAIEHGHRLGDADILAVWSLALAFSYWMEKSDVQALERLRDALLRSLGERDRELWRTRIPEVKSLPPPLREDAEDHDKEYSFHPVVTRPVAHSDEGYWARLNSMLLEMKAEDRRWGFHDKLLAIARERAVAHGIDVLLPGLQLQIEMHASWLFGKATETGIPWRALPDENQAITWQTVAVQLQKVLLTSYSAETIAASLEGMHSLVSNNPSVIPSLFDALKEPWAKRWLLNAAEAWAVLFPQSIVIVRDRLAQLMAEGDLDSRLQAWIVLARNCDVLQQERVAFPIPEVCSATPEMLEATNPELLHIPPLTQGLSVFANSYSSARSMLKYLEVFNFDFHPLEGLVAKGLFEHRDKEDSLPVRRGPHRRNDMGCSPLDAERAVGNAILQIIDSSWCGQEEIAQLSHAFLGNEDSWVYLGQRKPIFNVEEWPREEEYGPGEYSRSQRENRLQAVATTASLEDGWSVFAARIAECTWKEDFLLSYWLESAREDSLIIRQPRRPTCPGGRSFIWWIGQPIELEFDQFVAGLFVGGRQRLHNCHFEIRPPETWRTMFGWEPNERNPLEWTRDGEPVARYERWHGVLRDNPHGPNFRQPMLDRWIVTEQALNQVESIVGELRPRQVFESASYRDD